MTRDAFEAQYIEIVQRAIAFATKSRREGLLALEDGLDQEKIKERDIFEYGIQFVVDGCDAQIVEKILSNIVKQENDEDKLLLKTIQKEAVLLISAGMPARMLYKILDSYTDVAIKDDILQD
jgi:flagellar motor component MotA